MSSSTFHKAVLENEGGQKSGTTNLCPNTSLYILQMKTSGSEMLKHFTWILSTPFNFMSFLISNDTGPLKITKKKKGVRLSRGVKKPHYETQQ